MEVSEILLTILWAVVGIGMFVGWFWVVCHYLLRTGNFTCRKCHKKFPQKHETENNLCRWCKDKRERERQENKKIINYVLH